MHTRPSTSPLVRNACFQTGVFFPDGNQSGTPVRRHVEFQRKTILLNSVHYQSGASPEASDQSVNQSGSPEPVRDVFQTFEESPVRHHSPEPVRNQSGTSPGPVRNQSGTLGPPPSSQQHRARAKMEEFGEKLAGTSPIVWKSGNGD